MDHSAISKFLVSRFGGGYSNSAYYTAISSWLTWYKGYDESFHRVLNQNGKQDRWRIMYQLRMAKRVAEDWASAVSSEPPIIVVSSSTLKPSIFIQGSKNTTGVLGSNNFNELLSLCLERMFALGTSSVVQQLENIDCNLQGEIVDGTRGRIKVVSCDAQNIIPMSYANGEIVDCAFISQTMKDNKMYYILSVHKRESDGYVIYNIVLDSSYNTASYFPGMLPVIRTKCPYPLFEVFRTNIANNIDLDSPLGMSVYANAIDNLKSTDQAFDACIRDVVTGQRIILMNQCLLNTDDHGKTVVPQDAKQSYMWFFGDEASANINEFIKEFAPKLNTNELDKELQNQLNMLSFKCGLGTHYYNFDRSGGLTATEYSGERQDFVRNVRKMNISVSNGIARMVKTMLFLGRNILQNGVDDSAKVTVTMPDGIVEDDSKLMDLDLKLVEKGIMSKVEFRMKWFGESQEEAVYKLSLVLPVST